MNTYIKNEQHTVAHSKIGTTWLIFHLNPPQKKLALSKYVHSGFDIATDCCTVMLVILKSKDPSSNQTDQSDICRDVYMLLNADI